MAFTAHAGSTGTENTPSPRCAAPRRKCAASTRVCRCALALACVGFALLAAAACSGSGSGVGSPPASSAGFYTGGTPGGTPTRGGTAVIDRAEAPETMDPLEAGPPSQTVIALAVFDQLAETLPGADKEPQPGLAQSWSVSSDGLTVTFHIRPGVHFTNGEPLTGEDVVYTLDSLAKPEATAHYLSTLWNEVSLTGPLTVQIHLKRPTPALIDDLTLAPTSIVPKKVVEREGLKKFGLHPIGTGPFMITATTPGNTTVKMVRNPRYWRHGQPYLNGLVWNQVTEANARMLAVRSGAATIATGVPFSQAASLKKTSGVRLLVEPFSGSAWELVNNAAKPLDEINVRRALAYAIPRQAIIHAVYGGLGEPSNDVLGNQLKYWDPHVPTFPYDIAKAKELLRHSSVPNGFDVTIMIPSGEPEVALTAAIEQSAWAKIGVHAKIESITPASAFSNWIKSAYQIFLTAPELSVSEAYEPDPNLFTDMDYADDGTKAIFTNYDSPKVIALLRKAASSQSESERRKLFSEIQNLVSFQEAGFLSIAFVPTLTLVDDSLRGFSVPPTGYIHMEQAWIEK